MGCDFSREEEGPSELQILAAKKFHVRMRGYNYALHGSYVDYVQWCRGQFELDCLPDYVKYGHNYNPRDR